MHRLALLVLCALCAVGPAAQGPSPSAPPPRDSRGPSTTVSVGHARVFGRVLDAATSRPLRGALVLVLPRRLAGGPPIIDTRTEDGQPFATRTDDDGRFALSVLAPGEYALLARRAGYLDQQLGQASPGTPARQLVVEHGAVAGPIAFSLVRAAVISGRVLDATGVPADGIAVRASKRRYVQGAWRLQPMAVATTNDVGEFRVFGLPPGSYVVSAEPPRPFVPPETFVDVPTRDLVPTYAPSVASAADAQPVHLDAGEEANVDIHLIESAVASVAGRVVDSRGMSVREGTVHLESRGAVRLAPSVTTQLRADGTFAMTGIAAGAYTVVAMARLPATAGDGPPQAPRLEVGMIDVDLGGEVSGLLVTTQAGTTVRGRLVVDGDASALRGRDVRVQATSTVPGRAGTRQTRAPVAPDLTFEIADVRGPATLRLGNAPDGWWTRAVRVGRVDATDGYDFGAARTVTDVELVVSTRPSGLRGRVVDAGRTPAPDTIVVGFEEDERKRAHPTAETFMVRPVEDGGWSIDLLRPGAYRLVALPASRVRGDDITDPEYLRELYPYGRTIAIAEGQTAEVVLEVREP